MKTLLQHLCVDPPIPGPAHVGVPIRRTTLALLALTLTALPVAAQHDHANSPYAGTQSSDVPTLTDEEVRQLRDGDGMGLARPAELNGYPGPKHLLELADGLDLSDAQSSEIEAIRQTMLAAAMAKGQEILVVEDHLAAAFAAGTADVATVDRITAHLASLRGQLQAVHLVAHIESRALLSTAQIQRYNELRGY